MSIPHIHAYPMPLASELPESRVNWQPDPARALLLVHDMQRYFLEYYAAGREPVVALLENVRRLGAQCRAADVPVVYTAQPGDGTPGARGLLQDMWGPGILARPDAAPIAPEVAPGSSDRVLVKHRYSAFHHTELLEILRQSGRDQIWICGVYAHIGCLVTANDAFAHDVKPFLIADAVADFSRAHHDMALEFVAGRCGVVTRCESLLDRMGAGHSDDVAGDAWLLDELRALQVDVDRMLPDDALQDFGLDSVRLLELSERLLERDVPVSFMDMMERTSLAAMRAYLADVSEGVAAQ